jgi:hypothetical protein
MRHMVWKMMFVGMRAASPSALDEVRRRGMLWLVSLTWLPANRPHRGQLQQALPASEGAAYNDVERL